MKDIEREVFAKELLAKVFPPHARFDAGDIVDSTGLRIDPLGIVVEIPFHPSFPPVGSSSAPLYMAEGVVAILVVTSDLIRQWDEVRKTVGEVKRLKRVYRVGAPDKIPVFSIRYTGFSSVMDLKRRSKSSLSSRPDGALVLGGRGVYVSMSQRDWYSEAYGAEALYALVARIAAEYIKQSQRGPNFSAY